MLILTRKNGESIIIGDDIKITLVGVKGYQVKIGIDAPKEVSVHREEIYRRIKEQEDATAGNSADFVDEDDDDAGNK